MTADWSNHNEALVKRGEILLDLNLLQDWGQELEEMNPGQGRSPVPLPQRLHQFPGAPPRPIPATLQTAGRPHPGPSPMGANAQSARLLHHLPQSQQAKHRSRTPQDPGRPVTIAVDASGVKVSDRGEWMRAKWRRRRGFLKIHIAVDVETKQIVAMEVTDEGTGDGRMLVPLVEQAQRRCNVVRVLGDGAYDSRHNFSFLAAKGVEAGIKVRRSSSARARGCPARKMAVMEQLGDPEAWRRRVGYGGRWMAETAFSVIKRLFGEYVMARSFSNMVREMILKASLYNLFMSLNPATQV